MRKGTFGSRGILEGTDGGPSSSEDSATPIPEFNDRFSKSQREENRVGDSTPVESELDLSLAQSLHGRRGGAILPDGTRVTSAFRAKEALRLRLLGKNFGQIAEALGFGSPHAAHDAYRAALDWVAVENDLDAVVQAELLKLDQWQERLLDRYGGKPDARAVEVLVKVSERRSKLLGLDAPEKHLVKGQFDVAARISEVTPDFLAETIRELDRTNPRALTAHIEEPVDPPQADPETSSLPLSATA